MNTSGLSILIPVYMHDVRPLIEGLMREIPSLSIPIEVIVYDDESSWQYLELNREIEKYKAVHYVELLQNVGRSTIRNMMAQSARYESLLLLDADSEVISPNFLADYISNSSKADIIVGGRVYTASCPHPEVQLRWNFGVSREVTTAQNRAKSPFENLMTNNLFIKKEVLLAIGLDEDIEGYGHEDTLLGEQLEKKGVSILHIDNPLKHIGLESNPVFLEKSMEAVRNLSRLIRSGKGGTHTRIYKAWLKMQWFLPQMVLKMVKANQYTIKNRLESGNASLWLYDLYRLHYFNELMKQ